jgi:hypothetical protein
MVIAERRTRLKRALSRLVFDPVDLNAAKDALANHESLQGS